jgi:hypothetical protein
MTRAFTFHPHPDTTVTASRKRHAVWMETRSCHSFSQVAEDRIRVRLANERNERRREK